MTVYPYRTKAGVSSILRAEDVYDAMEYLTNTWRGGTRFCEVDIGSEELKELYRSDMGDAVGEFLNDNHNYKT